MSGFLDSNGCAHENIIVSSGYRCMNCGADLETMRWQVEQRTNLRLANVLEGLADVLARTKSASVASKSSSPGGH